MSTPRYRRVLLKLSGEALRGKEASGVDPEVLRGMVREVAEVHALGVQLGIVIGGGNYFRGAQATWMDRARADYVGMMATIMNGLTLQEAFRQEGVPCALFSGLVVEGVVAGYDHELVSQAVDAGKVAVFAGGTGHPFFSTDTAAALRAGELGAEVLMKATQVDGVYDKDPREHADASRFSQLTYLHLLQENLRVMDATSVSFCREYGIPILVFNVAQKGHLKRAVLGDAVGTLICEKAESEVEAE